MGATTSFTSVGRSTGTQGIILWLDRNDAVDTKNTSPADAWRNFLQRQVGSAGTDGKRDLERLWLAQRITALGGAAGAGSGLSGLWSTYFSLKGHTGSINDQFAQWIDHGTN